jgi:hypothetical protein
MPIRTDTGFLAGAVVVFVPAGAAEHRIHLLIGGLGILAASVLGLMALVGRPPPAPPEPSMDRP